MYAYLEEVGLDLDAALQLLQLRQARRSADVALGDDARGSGHLDSTSGHKTVLVVMETSSIFHPYASIKRSRRFVHVAIPTNRSITHQGKIRVPEGGDGRAAEAVSLHLRLQGNGSQGVL